MIDGLSTEGEEGQVGHECPGGSKHRDVGAAQTVINWKKNNNNKKNAFNI